MGPLVHEVLGQTMLQTPFFFFFFFPFLLENRVGVLTHNDCYDVMVLSCSWVLLIGFPRLMYKKKIIIMESVH